jgi:hypothetical protein
VEATEPTYRAATPADEPLLTQMLWHASNWRDEDVASDHWPDPTAPAKSRRRLRPAR